MSLFKSLLSSYSRPSNDEIRSAMSLAKSDGKSKLIWVDGGCTRRIEITSQMTLQEVEKEIISGGQVIDK